MGRNGWLLCGPPAAYKCAFVDRMARLSGCSAVGGWPIFDLLRLKLVFSWMNQTCLSKAVEARVEKYAQRGFSLIELMIATAIIAVLAAIAIPNYQQYRVKANRADLQAFLMTVAQRQQQYLLDSRAFAGTLVDLGISPPDKVASNYTITVDIDAGPPPTFLLTATPIATSSQSADGVLTLDQSGAKQWNGQPW